MSWHSPCSLQLSLTWLLTLHQPPGGSTYKEGERPKKTPKGPPNTQIPRYLGGAALTQTQADPREITKCPTLGRPKLT